MKLIDVFAICCIFSVALTYKDVVIMHGIFNNAESMKELVQFIVKVNLVLSLIFIVFSTVHACNLLQHILIYIIYFYNYLCLQN